MKWCLIFAVSMEFLFSALTCGAAENRQSTRDYTGSAVDWYAQASVSHLVSAGLRHVSGDASISDYRVRGGRNIQLNDALTLTLGGGYGLKHVEASHQAGLPSDLHALFFEAGATYRFNDRGFANIKAFPGVYSDFKNIGGDDVRMPVLALGGYNFESGISLVGGFLYRFGYHSAQLIPVLGISYQPNQEWKLDLVMPRPSITYSASRQLQLFVGGDFSSDEYELKDRSYGAKVIKYGDYKVLGGVGYQPIADVKLTTAAGYAFERRFTFYDGYRPDLRLEDSPFFRVSVDVGW